MWSCAAQGSISYLRARALDSIILLIYTCLCFYSIVLICRRVQVLLW
jgi:hypothetical protein